MKTAAELAVESVTRVRAGDREGWLGLFPEDGWVQDPVGKSPTDPTGLGHRGKAAIIKFYDNVIAHNKGFDFTLNKVIPGGDDEAAVLITFHLVSPDGKKRDIQAINHYARTKDGKLASLRSFWNFSDLD